MGALFTNITIGDTYGRHLTQDGSEWLRIVDLGVVRCRGRAEIKYPQEAGKPWN